MPSDRRGRKGSEVTRREVYKQEELFSRSNRIRRRVPDVQTIRLHILQVALRKIDNRQGEVGRVLCDQVARGSVVGNSGGQNTETTANLGHLDLLHECTNHEEHESEGQEEKQRGQCYGRTQRSEEHQLHEFESRGSSHVANTALSKIAYECEDEPGHKEEAHSILKVTRVGFRSFVSGHDTEGKEQKGQ